MFWVEGKASVKAVREERICVANTAAVSRICTWGPKLEAPIHSFLPQSVSGNHLESLSIWPHGNICDSWLPPQAIRVLCGLDNIVHTFLSCFSCEVESKAMEPMFFHCPCPYLCYTSLNEAPSEAWDPPPTFSNRRAVILSKCLLAGLV